MKNLPTQDQIDELWVRFWTETTVTQGKTVPISTIVRFGQFVYNETNFETDNSYFIVDPEAAYKNIHSYIAYHASLA